jgi:hypothetical protein
MNTAECIYFPGITSCHLRFIMSNHVRFSLAPSIHQFVLSRHARAPYAFANEYPIYVYLIVLCFPPDKKTTALNNVNSSGHPTPSSHRNSRIPTDCAHMSDRNNETGLSFNFCFTWAHNLLEYDGFDIWMKFGDPMNCYIARIPFDHRAYRRYRGVFWRSSAHQSRQVKCG